MKNFQLKTLAAQCGLCMLASCATMGPPRPPSLDLPKPPSDLRATRKGEKVTLTWTIPTVTTDRQRVRELGPTRVCRGLEAQLTQCGTPVGESAAKTSTAGSAKQKVAESYIDSLPSEYTSNNPSASITYAVEVLNTDGHGAGLSNQVQVSLVGTPAPPGDFSAQLTSKGVVLTFTNDLGNESLQAAIHYLYRIHRRQEGSPQEILLSEIPAGAPDVSVTDSSIEWEKTYEYRVDVVTVVAQGGKPEMQVEGDDTPEIKVFADDTFPPAVPPGLQAVFSGPGQALFIDLVWAPVPDTDLAGYNVYRREEGGAVVKLNSELLTTPAYRDTKVVAGKVYFYSVSAVDLRGNESARSEEASERVP